MSVHYHVRIGPYIRCETATEPLTKEVNVCSSTDCNTRKCGKTLRFDVKFCPLCGSETTRGTRPVEGHRRATIDADQVREGTDERLYEWNGNNSEENGIHLFVPNHTGARGTTFGQDEDASSGEIVTDVPAKVVDEITWLMNAYAKEIAFCKKLYGDANVKVCWGALGGWS